jgi:hypothetical protein
MPGGFFCFIHFMMVLRPPSPSALSDLLSRHQQWHISAKFVSLYTQSPVYMSVRTEKKLLDYYHAYCELIIWFKKIVLQGNPQHLITVQDITEEFIRERNRILLYVPSDRRRHLRTRLNAIATAYYSKIEHWSRKQKITIDMV